MHGGAGTLSLSPGLLSPAGQRRLQTAAGSGSGGGGSGGSSAGELLRMLSSSKSDANFWAALQVWRLGAGGRGRGLDAFVSTAKQ